MLSPRIGALRKINCLCSCQNNTVILFFRVRPRRSGHRAFCFFCGGNALVILIPFLIHSHHREYCFPQCGGICGKFLTLMPARYALMGILRNRCRSIGCGPTPPNSGKRRRLTTAGRGFAGAPRRGSHRQRTKSSEEQAPRAGSAREKRQSMPKS